MGYADPESGCQAYRVCNDGRDGPQGAGFVCPNGTLFDQHLFRCEFWHTVDCSAAVSLYSLNADPLLNPYLPKPILDEYGNPVPVVAHADPHHGVAHHAVAPVHHAVAHHAAPVAHHAVAHHAAPLHHATPIHPVAIPHHPTPLHVAPAAHHAVHHDVAAVHHAAAPLHHAVAPVHHAAAPVHAVHALAPAPVHAVAPVSHGVTPFTNFGK